MDGFLVDPAAVEPALEILRTGAADLESTADPPAPPEAGECSAAIGAVLALLTDSVAGAVEGLDVVAGAAAADLVAYQGVDADQAAGLDSVFTEGN